MSEAFVHIDRLVLQRVGKERTGGTPFAERVSAALKNELADCAPGRVDRVKVSLDPHAAQDPSAVARAIAKAVRGQIR